ncbi:hypothetical protein LNQ52_00070 [Klebsiella pneumoniae subsp. pneumoniae]|nr:hypothetical protein [Klebsiella pneumoniae subsp. pneumoniae]
MVKKIPGPGGEPSGATSGGWGRCALGAAGGVQAVSGCAVPREMTLDRRC